MTTYTSVTGDWTNTLSYTNLYSDNKLTNKIGKYSEYYNTNEKGGLYLFEGNICFDDKEKSALTFGANSILVPGEFKYNNPLIFGSGKYLNKKGTVQVIVKEIVESIIRI
jgi:hypothetical protein